MFEARNISIAYGDKTVIREVSFSLAEGETLSVVGPSGCGKTTLLYALCGLKHPETGMVHISGSEITRPSKKISIILQDYGLLPWKNVSENVALGLKINGVKKAERIARAERLLVDFGLEGRGNEFPSNLSGGEQQRVAIARAFIVEPEAMLLDEPFSSLDALTREHLQQTLLDVWEERKIPYVLVTHSLEEAIYLGKKIMVLGGCPALPVKVLENPVFGSKNVRQHNEYYKLLKELRVLLEGGAGNRAEDSCED